MITTIAEDCTLAIKIQIEIEGTIFKRARFVNIN